MRADLRSILMKKRFSLLMFIGLFGIAFLGGAYFNQVVSGDNIYEQIRKFQEVLSLAEKFYVDDVQTSKLTEDAISGMLTNLDPHSVYIKPETLKRVNEDFKGKFEGIGIEFQIVNDTITVVQPIGGGPSAILGIMSNDKIVKIDGKSAIGFNNDQVMKNLRGDKGTKVSVSINRAGVKELIEYEIVRDVIPLYSVDVSTMIENGVGYISVSRFSETTTREMIEGLEKLKAQGLKRLVLDLRFNPGGYLDQAVKISDLFLGADENGKQRKIVYTTGRRPEFNEEYFTSSGSPYEKIPLIILISNASASASEIVSGAIQDWDRGLIVGETSFGKGLVQRQFELPDRSALRLTIARYYTPSGRLIQRSYQDGKEKYQMEAFNREEEEGENIEHKEVESDSSRPHFKTSKGREILGGGGITPDYIVKPASATKYSTSLNRRNMFYQFISGYLSEHGPEIRKTYNENFRKFNTEYQVTEKVLQDFIAFTKGNGIDFVEADYSKDKEYIQARLKAYIARSIWGNEGWYPIMLSVDNQLKKAISLFPEAEKIAQLH